MRIIVKLDASISKIHFDWNWNSNRPYNICFITMTPFEFFFFFFLFQREIKRRSRQQSNKLSPTVSIFVWTDAKKSTDSHPRPHFRHSYRVEFRSPPVRIPFARGFCKQSRARWKRNCPTKLSGDREDQEVIAVDSAGKDNTRE